MMMRALSTPVSLPVDAPLVTVTRPKPWLWVIELHNGQDSRLTPTVVDGGLKPALDVVEREWREGWRKRAEKDEQGGRGAVIIVGRRDQDKFFSNGLDLTKVVGNPAFFPVTFNPLLMRLLTFPIPTIAAINGHCFAGGFMLSLACDYRVAKDGKMWLCMNEVAFGSVWPLSFAALLRAKIGSGQLHRKIALEGHRFTPQEGLEAGIVDYVVSGKTGEVMGKAEEVAWGASGNAVGGVWGLIKNDLYRDTLEVIHKDHATLSAEVEDEIVRSRL